MTRLQSLGSGDPAMTGQPGGLSRVPESQANDGDAAERARRVREGLRCLQLSGAFFLRADFTAPWAYLSPESAQIVDMLQPGSQRVLLFHIFTAGRCRVQLDRGGELEFGAGDIAIFPFADQHRVGDPDCGQPVPIQQLLPPPPWQTLPVVRHGGGGAATSMVCGYLMSDDLPFNPVLASLPPLVRVPVAGGPLAEWVAASVQYALHASEGGGADSPLLQRLPELLFTECLCEHARLQIGHDGQGEPAGGWLGGLADPIVGRALACLHREPAFPWSLKELARRAATSRSVLDERFRLFLGQAPMSYLTAWRLQLASRQLRTTTANLAEVAQAVGYSSEASFSRAFKRQVGVSPSQWRG